MRTDQQETQRSTVTISPAQAIEHISHWARFDTTRHNSILLTDQNLNIVGHWGDEWCSGMAAIGDSLDLCLPELHDHSLELADVLAGRLNGLDLGLLQRPILEGVYWAWVKISSVQQEAGVTGLMVLVLDAGSLGDRIERLERQRRELFDMRQQLAQANIELAFARTEVERLDEAKSQFVSAAAHELRNPLASLMGFVELFSDEDTSNLRESQRQYLAGLSRGAQRLRQLTNNLLDITRVDANRIELQLEPMDALSLIEQAVADMQPLFDIKKQRIFLKSEARVPRILADGTRALQILGNLLSNAHKYTPPGGSITVQASRVKGQPFALLRVIDTGIGIPADEQYKIFTRFFRGSNAGAADGSGAGLGLALTHSLVSLHGGKIWFESRPGQGATFLVTFPIAP